jgi:hypothetical protein
MNAHFCKIAGIFNNSSCYFFIAFFFLSCGQQKPEYISSIPDYDSFEYLTPQDWANVQTDTTIIDVWYDNENENGVVLSMVADILYTSNDLYWITDLSSGKVFEFNKDGNFNRELFRRGMGPSELLRPVSLAISTAKNIYILDTDQQMIMVSDSTGIEISRYRLKDLPNSFGGNKLTVLSENELIWPTYRQPYVLSIRDTLGNIKSNLIKRIIPQGYQPSMHNNVTYDIIPTGDTFIYAYQGLPVIFGDIEGEKVMINLEPDSELDELNTTFDLRPVSEATTVSVLIREIFYKDNIIWVAYKSNLYEIPLDRGSQIIKHTFVDNKREQVFYQPVFNTSSDIFLVNYNKAQIYKFLISKPKPNNYSE